MNRVGTTESVYVDGAVITGDVYHVRENGWACVKTDSGRIASGPSPTNDQRSAAEIAAFKAG